MTTRVAPLPVQEVAQSKPISRDAVTETAALVNAVAQQRFLGLPAAATDVITDVSYATRAVLPCVNVSSTALDATLGMSTTLNAILAYNSYLNAAGAAQHAAEADDHDGVQVAQVDQLRCVAQGIGGAYYVGVRALSAAAYVKGVDTSGVAAPTLLGRVTFVVSAAGAALWGLVYLILCVVCGMKIYHGHQFRKELEAAEALGDKAVMAFVESCRDQQAKLERLTNGDCAKRMEEVCNPEQAHELFKDMKAALDKKFWINLGYLIACAIGVAATVASFIAMGPVGILIVAIAFVVVGTMMTGLDGYCLTEAIKEAEPGTFDKKMLAISSTVAAIAFAAAIALISVFSLGLVPLIAAIIIGAVWLGTNAYVWMTLREVEQRSLPYPRAVGFDGYELLL